MKKPNESQVTEFEALTAQMKLMEKRREELASEFKAFGPFTVGQFVVSVADRTRESMVGIEKAASALGGKEKLQAMGLISVSQFKVIQVSRKGA